METFSVHISVGHLRVGHWLLVRTLRQSAHHPITRAGTPCFSAEASPRARQGQSTSPPISASWGPCEELELWGPGPL